MVPTANQRSMGERGRYSRNGPATTEVTLSSLLSSNAIDCHRDFYRLDNGANGGMDVHPALSDEIKSFKLAAILGNQTKNPSSAKSFGGGFILF